MRVPRTLPLAVALVAACTDLGVHAPPPAATAGLRVINATSAPATVLVDGQPVTANLGQATLSAPVGLPPGSYTVQVARSGITGFPRDVFITNGDTTTLIALDSAGGITADILADSGTAVPAGASRLRVAHMATSAAPISIWRTQPDSASPARVRIPFPFRAISSYIQSSPGDWRVLISSEVNTAGTVPMPDTLAKSGLITLAPGESATVVVVDEAGGGYGILVVVP